MSGREHGAQLLKAGRAVDLHSGHGAQVGYVEYAVVGLPVLAGQPRPVHLCGIEGASVIRSGTDVTIAAYGTMVNEAVVAIPAAMETACPSAMPTSKKRLGNSLAKPVSPVPSGMAAGIALPTGPSRR